MKMDNIRIYRKFMKRIIGEEKIPDKNNIIDLSQ